MLGSSIAFGSKTNITDTPTTITVNSASPVLTLVQDGAGNLITAGTSSVDKFYVTAAGVGRHLMYALGTTPTTGLWLDNQTAAADGAQQYSSGLQWTGTGWKSNATAGSQLTEARMYLASVQGEAAPTFNLLIDAKIGAGAYSNIWSLSSVGLLTLAGGLNIAASKTLLIGSATAYNSDNEINALSANKALTLNGWSATAAESATLSFIRSKAAAIGTKTAVASADRLGYIPFYGYDTQGTPVATLAGYWEFLSTGTIGNSRVPGSAKLVLMSDAGTPVATTVWTATAASITVGTNMTLGSNNLTANVITWGQNLQASADGRTFDTSNGDNAHISIRARDNGVGLAEVARMVSAADPYFQMTLAMRLLPIATASLPATPVEGMLVYDDTANKLKFYNGSAWETVTSAVV